MVVIECDLCGKELERYEVRDDFQLMKYKAQGRICCEECEKKWEAYEKEIAETESKHKGLLEEELNKIKERYFNSYSSSNSAGKSEKIEEQVQGRMERRGAPHFKLR